MKTSICFPFQKARLCLKYWSGQIELPPKEQMIQDFHIESERRKEQGKSIRQSHLLNMDQVRYIYLLL